MFPNHISIGDSANGSQKTTEPKMIRQENRILEIITELCRTPESLPRNPPGKPGVKSKVKEKALEEPALFTAAAFDAAWKRLSKDGKISIVK